MHEKLVIVILVIAVPMFLHSFCQRVYEDADESEEKEEGKKQDQQQEEVSAPSLGSCL